MVPFLEMISFPLPLVLGLHVPVNDLSSQLYLGQTGPVTGRQQDVLKCIIFVLPSSYYRKNIYKHALK